MPYFVFHVKPFAQFEKLAEFPAFREASKHAKALRAARADPAGRIKVMFADNERLAEDLLCQIREPGPAGDD
ncbi:MAG: hypothetical protein IPP87_23190 [Ideonella sp.]|jgi:hypothetical protein|nr:hypothetical protein [Ideonella sp.]MBL0149202.1 hypothetical protein [Ideonella sp.]MBL0151404.1 hypothetical protein [Ideonella sp.]